MQLRRAGGRSRRPTAASRRGCGGRRARRRDRARAAATAAARGTPGRRSSASTLSSTRASCEPTWTWTPSTSSPSSLRPLDLPLGGIGCEAELRLLVRRLDRAVRHGLDSRRQADEDAPHARRGRRLRLARRVENDERACLRGRPQLLLRLVVAVEDEPLARDPRRPRERELAEGRDVGARSLLREQPQRARRSRTPSSRRRRARPARPRGTPAPGSGSFARSRRGAASRTRRRAPLRVRRRGSARRPRPARFQEGARAPC